MEDKSEQTLKLAALDNLAARVDTVFQGHLALIDVVGIRVASNLVAQHEHVADGPDKAICVLLLNAMSSLMAALELARRGFPIQVGILVRNSIEVMAVAAVINSDGQAYEKYKQGRLDSPSCIGIVKKTWPEVGSVLAKAWGNLSNDFTHVGNLYKRWQTVSSAPTYGELFALGTVLLAIKAALHTLDLLSEVTCYRYVQEPRFWKRLEANKYMYDPTPEGKAWMETFLTDPCKDVPPSENTESPKADKEEESP